LPDLYSRPHTMQVEGGTMEMQIAAWVASSLVFTTFFMRTMLALRIVAVMSNIAFIVYALLALRHGIFEVVLPIFVLHSLLLPLNLRRMKEQHSIKFEHDRTIGLAAGSRRDAHYAYRGIERVLDKRDHARA
jgi:hypothetical protein